jgi:hypothetical protein
MDALTMKKPTELQQQKYERIGEIAAKGRQRYLEAGGDQKICPGGRKGNDYLTDEERKEILQLARQVFGVQIKDEQVYCQGRTWKISDKKVSKDTEK